MFLTGCLTAGVAFTVYLYVLKTETPEAARTYAFAVLVFAELLRSFGARSETRPVWRISLFTNVNLLIVVALSFGLQVWSQHSATLGHFLKTSHLPLTDCLLLLAVGAVPLLVLEMVKIRRHARSKEQSGAS
jgi:Ca2+-transporting ATPase